jgi:DNA-binding SARP family transcriptional activator
MPLPRQAYLFLLGGFELRRGAETLALPLATRRVLAFLAVSGQPVSRSYVAGSLWLESSEARAGGCLRTALWHIQRTGLDVVVSKGGAIGLAPSVAVDVHERQALAERALGDAERFDRNDVRVLCAWGDLLPDWYDEWLLIPRERFRQLRLHGLEELAVVLADEGRFAEAVEAGLAAVAADPLRESAHRALILVHLAEGNRHEAARQLAVARSLFLRHLGVDVSPRLVTLVERVPSRR